MAQIKIKMALPLYMTADMQQDGVLISVTRQISEDCEGFFQKYLPEAEIFSFKGRRYVSIKKFFYMCYPRNPKVLDWGKSAHKRIMNTLDLYEISYRTNRIIMRSEKTV